MSQVYKLPRSVQVIIFTESTDRREFLLLKRIAQDMIFWQAVTGSLEEGETHREAAVREVQEETGIICRDEDLIDLHLINVFEIAPAWRARFRPGTTHNEEVCFALKVEPCEIQLDAREHIAFTWVDYDTAVSMLYWESNKKAFAVLQRLLGVDSSASCKE
jgi:dihydroneopterin triphosphate diphosphatase